MEVVKPMVQLFSDGLTNGKLPDAASWLGTMDAAYNHNHMGEILRIFKVRMSPRANPPQGQISSELVSVARRAAAFCVFWLMTSPP